MVCWHEVFMCISFCLTSYGIISAYFENKCGVWDESNAAGF
ncbi:hypothetical protein BN1804_02526 [Proteus penneri]|uniref:Uncharacterized protein n=1 Tax=Proteus penneri TaxID=102862 RepID=A0A0G4QD63_9GAMM|nr:hypothetical protein BN1804_02526 [Proteus penneri]SUC02662.1 Uncharacterised protein [Proteus penneri]